jgi:protoporphyrinogen oxidase
MLGMTLALRLAQAGHRVELLEAADHLGGLADAWRLGSVTWDRHYHVTLLSDQHLRNLLAELALDEQMQWVETKTGFFVDGQLYSLSNSWEFLRFPPLSLLDKARLAATIMRASRIRDSRGLEAIPVETWLRRWSGNRTYERIWCPLLKAKLGENYTKASAAFIWSTIQRMYAARRTGLKKEMFGYLPGGYARLLTALQLAIEQAGVMIRTGCAVASVRRDNNGALRTLTTEGEEIVSDCAVVTAPAEIAAKLCPQLSSGETALLSDVEYQGIVCASLLLKKPLSPFYVTNITDAWVPFTAIIETTTLVDCGEVGGCSLIYLPKYLPANHAGLNEPEAEIKERFVAALERMHPHFTRDDVMAFRLSRAKHVMPIPTLHYSQRLPPVATTVPGLFLLNSAHIVNGTLNVNETIKLAEQALPQLLATATSRASVGSLTPRETYVHSHC